jgi:hypothetical protein
MNPCRVNRCPYNDSGRPWGLSVSGKIAHYGSSSLSGGERSSLLVGTDSLAGALLRHFGSLKALFRASFKELRRFLSRPEAEAVKRRFRWALSLRRNTLCWLSSTLPNRSSVVILAYSLSDTWRHHSCYAELRCEIGLGPAFQLNSGEMQRRHGL